MNEIRSVQSASGCDCPSVGVGSSVGHWVLDC